MQISLRNRRRRTIVRLCRTKPQKSAVIVAPKSYGVKVRVSHGWEKCKTESEWNKSRFSFGSEKQRRGQSLPVPRVDRVLFVYRFHGRLLQRAESQLLIFLKIELLKIALSFVYWFFPSSMHDRPPNSCQTKFIENTRDKRISYITSHILTLVFQVEQPYYVVTCIRHGTVTGFLTLRRNLFRWNRLRLPGASSLDRRIIAGKVSFHFRFEFWNYRK